MIDEEGRVLRTISLLQAFDRSSYRGILDRMPEGGGLFHTNTVEVFDGSLEALSPLYRRGNALISLLTVDAIGSRGVEYYNPARAGERKELIATLFEVVRIPARDLDPWFEAPGDKDVR